jgi:thiamine pyrophosphokinase
MENNIKARIINEENEINLINSSMEFEGDKDYNISLVPLSKYVKGINSKGLYYPHNNMNLKRGQTIGISNKFIKKRIFISVESGVLIVIKSKD